jgi:hypothetical protein
MIGVWGIVLVVAAVVVVVPLLGHSSSPGHPNLTGLIVGISVIVIIVAVSVGISWHFIRHDEPTRRLMQVDWRTRRRVGIALRKGRPIPESDLEAAQATIDLFRRRGQVGWFFLVAGVTYLFMAVLDHGNQRWFQLAMSIIYSAFVCYWLHLRKQILSREAEIATPDSLEDSASTNVPRS